MDLSPEDSLRLNVLLSQGLLAVRIDESRMVVYALTEKGEAKIPLNPNCRDEQYIRNVKALLSSHSLGSPGGYPVYLKRWTRMGQAKDESLEQLLLLGEEEAVVAVVHAAGLTNELARRAWWAMPTTANARRMLEKQAVIQGDMGPVLAEFLIEHLPFEEEPLSMIDSVKAALQPGLVSQEQVRDLWTRAKSKGAYFVGFLHAIPHDLPGDAPASPAYETACTACGALADAGNPVAELVMRVLSPAGQNYLNTVELALKRPGNQDVVVSLFMAIENYYAAISPGFKNKRDINAIIDEAHGKFDQANAELEAVKQALPDLDNQLKAMLVLSGYCEQLLFPVFGQTDAVGSVMRKKIEHLTTPLKQQLAILRS